MLKTLAAALVMTAAAAAPAMAYDNFIPMGTGYSPTHSSLPALNSSADQITKQTDLFETEIYRKQEAERLHDSYVQRFITTTETTGGSTFIDY